MNANTLMILVCIGLAAAIILIRWAVRTLTNKGADAIQHKINEKQNAKHSEEMTSLAERYGQAETQTAEESAGQQETSAKNNFCMSCGAQLKEGAKFCAKCGAKVE